MQDPACTATWRWSARALAQVSTRPDLPWTFIVLDTDAVNAFAAPGGYVHITRGALALIKNEAELAGVLGHEIIHVTEKHTIRAIQKSKAVQMGAAETLSGSAALMERAVTAIYDNIVERGFGRAEENESDEKGVALANKTGYAPNGLVGVPDDAEGSQQGRRTRSAACSPRIRRCRSGSIALTKQIAAQKLTATATVEPRYARSSRYKPVPHRDRDRRCRAPPAWPAATPRPKRRRPEEKKAEEPKKGGFGLGKCCRPAAARRSGPGDRLGRRARSRSREGRQGRPEPGDRAR